MKFSWMLAEIFTRGWGIKDHDYSSFLVGNAKKELALDRTDLDQLIITRLRELLRHAEQTSAYYARAFDSYGVSSKDLRSIDDIKAFPSLTREILAKSLSDIISGGTVLPSWHKSSTGGTTSSPIIFYRDNEALWRKNAFSKAMDCWYGRRTGDRVAYLWGASQDIPDRLTISGRLRNITYQRQLVLPSTPLDESILQEYYKKLIQWCPLFLQAYPIPLYEFCLFLRNKGLHLPFLQAVTVTAETLSDYHRQVIEEVLCLQVYNWYGSRELGRVASECECHDGFHINEPSVYVEIEPDPCLPENYGYLIITDLLNRATPLIRYRTGDIGLPKEGQCRCGRNLLRIGSIGGRVTDLVTLPGGRKVRLSNQHDFQEIKELQIIQRSPTDFLVRFVRGPQFGPFTLETFVTWLYNRLDMKVSVSFEEVARIACENSGKVRLVINEMAYDSHSEPSEERLPGELMGSQV